MFTGLIEEKGIMEDIKRVSGDYAIIISTGKDFINDIKNGDSISVDGVCLTVEKIEGLFITFYALFESAQRSIIKYYKNRDVVNLERSLKFGDRIGGHLVYGHVDTVGDVKRVTKPNKNKMEIMIELVSRYGKFLVENDSIAVNGVSLTIKSVFDNIFVLDIIPETLSRTNFTGIKAGDKVNIEINQITKNTYQFLKE